MTYQGHFLRNGHFERSVRKASDGLEPGVSMRLLSNGGEAYFVSIVHAHSNTRSFEIEHVHGNWLRAILRGENQLELSRSRNNVVRRAVLKNSVGCAHYIEIIVIPDHRKHDDQYK